MIAALLAGTAAGLSSVPHCAAMCGPVAALGGGGRHAVAFQASRLLAYTLLGAAAGTVGDGLRGLFSDARIVHWLLATTLAVGLGLAARRLWGDRRPRLVPLRLTAPAAKPLRRSALLGASTACLPCGALLAGALVAASTGTTSGGALAMGAFAIASSPGLWAAGFAASRAGILSDAGRRGLAVVLALGAVTAAARGVDALRSEPPCCEVRSR